MVDSVAGRLRPESDQRLPSLIISIRQRVLQWRPFAAGSQSRYQGSRHTILSGTAPAFGANRRRCEHVCSGSRPGKRAFVNTPEANGSRCRYTVATLVECRSMSALERSAPIHKPRLLTNTAISSAFCAPAAEATCEEIQWSQHRSIEIRVAAKHSSCATRSRLTRCGLAVARFGMSLTMRAPMHSPFRCHPAGDQSAGEPSMFARWWRSWSPVADRPNRAATGGRASASSRRPAW